MANFSSAPLVTEAYSTIYTDVKRALIKRLWNRFQESQAGPTSGTTASGQRRPPGMVQGMPPGLFDQMIEDASHRHQIDPNLVRAVIKVESNYDPQAVSYAGAKGLMQLMDGTAEYLGVQNSFDPSQNIEGGVKYLAQQLQTFDGDVRLALAAYNAGPGNVQKYGGVPPFDETQKYVQRVLGNYQPPADPGLDLFA